MELPSYVGDRLRAASIIVVVFGHWFIGVIWWRNGKIGTISAIGLTGWLWIATWFLQVIPLFFFVGGFSNYMSYESLRRRGASPLVFLRSRAERLLKPTLVFVGVWAAIEVVLHLLDLGGTGLLRGVRPPEATVPFGPLWFLAVYFVVVMTLFLWHMTAYLIAILLLWPLGFGKQGDTTASWWIERPLWEVVPAIFLFALIWMFGRFERPSAPGPAAQRALRMTPSKGRSES